MSRSQSIASRQVGLTAAVALVVGFAVMRVALAAGDIAEHAPAAPPPRSVFARPAAIPYPGTAPPNAEQIGLGARLFSDVRLSANGEISCSTCHDSELAFTDGVMRGQGIAKVPLARHTPALWNLAWSETLFWDGRAPSLEAQARGPIEHPLEMGQTIAAVAGVLAADPKTSAEFARAFPGDPLVTPDTIVRALAAYERTLVSPPTRFDRFVAGDDAALSPSERIGYDLFTGRAQCVSCHSGWAFTDRAFHDIGLPTDDLGRGPVIGLPAVNHAFKTPSLRELNWTAPYMHDGSLATLEDVARHYESGGIDRPSRSPDLPHNLILSDDERAGLVAFLGTLSSERPPRPDASIGFTGAPVAAPVPVATSEVVQRDKAFMPAAVRVKRGEALHIINDDTRPHNVRVFDPRLTFDSGLQEPGETARITFPESGTFDVFCAIHPSMKLKVKVE